MTKQIENLKRFLDFAVSKGLFQSAQAVNAVKEGIDYAEQLEGEVKMLSNENEELRALRRDCQKELELLQNNVRL